MTQPDIPTWAPNADSEPSQSLESIATFVAQLSQFIDHLPTSMSPERETREMDFMLQPDTIYAYPELLQDYLLTRTLDSIHVTTVKEGDEFVATTLEFTNSTDHSTLHISRTAEPIAPDDMAPDAITWPYKDSEPVPRMNDREIDAFLLTLCGRPVQAEAQKLNQDTVRPIITDQLTHALSDNAFMTTAISSYELDSGRTLELTTETMTGKTVVKSFAICYETGSDRQLRATIDTSRGLQVGFETIDRANDDEVVQPFIPDDGDYIRLAEILKEELAALQADTAAAAPADLIALTDETS